jgi:hypothetical protein
MKENGVEGIMFKIKEKYDCTPQYLTLWADDDCPDLCPVWLLFVYLFLTGIKGGHLFPSDNELNKMLPNGICQKFVLKKTADVTFAFAIC